MYYIDASSFFRLSFVSAFKRRPFKQPAVKNLLLFFIDKGFFFHKPKIPVVSKPWFPCFSESLLSPNFSARPIIKNYLFMKEGHNPFEVMIVPGEIPLF